MPPADLLSLFVRPLNRLGWAYAVTGAVASMFYAEPRFTNDIDVVVRIPQDGGRPFAKPSPNPSSTDPPSTIPRLKETSYFVASAERRGLTPEILASLLRER